MKAGADYIGVGVGAFILSDDGLELLLVQRLREPEAGAWSIPGGKVEFGETFESALKREILEETGLQIDVGRILSLTDHIVGDPMRHWVTPQFLCRIVGGALENREPEKHGALGWYKLSALPSPLSMPTINALRAYGQSE